MKHIFKKPKMHKQKLLAFILPLLMLSACMEDDFDGELRGECPAVEAHTPADQDGVQVNTLITARFNKEMKPESINNNTFIVRDASGVINGNISFSDQTATFSPVAYLPEQTEITVEITTEVYDFYDFTIKEPYDWSFTTGTIDDISSPYVIQTIPENNQSDVPVDTHVSAIFNEELDPATVTPESLSLVNMASGEAVAGDVTYADMMVTFTPSDNLDKGVAYEAIVAAGIADLNGNVMENDYRWEFVTVEEDVADVDIPVNIDNISGYVILSGSYIRNIVGQSEITGDVGIYPGVRKDITGIDENDVDGNIIATDEVPIPGLPQLLIRAKQYLAAAYNDAKDADDPEPHFLSGNQAGVTLTPGIYSANNLRVNGGDLVLDAGGNPDAFWIFQVESLLETSGNIVLEGGANPENIYWQVGVREILGPNVLLGENTHFYGTILSKQGISVGLNGNVTGRLMVKDGGVRLNNAIISLP